MAEKDKRDSATPEAPPPFTMNTSAATTSFSLGTAPAGQGDLSTAASAVTVSSLPLALPSSCSCGDLLFHRHKLVT